MSNKSSLELNQKYIKVECASCKSIEDVYFASKMNPPKRCTVCDAPLYSLTGGNCKIIGSKISAQSIDE